MDSSELRYLSNRKISATILIWIVLAFLLFSINQFNSNRKLKKEISEIRKELKNLNAKKDNNGHN